jgi:hypothetical protein
MCIFLSYVIFAEQVFLPQIKSETSGVFTVFSITLLCISKSIIVYVLNVTPLLNSRYLPFYIDSCLIIDRRANCYVENPHYFK